MNEAEAFDGQILDAIEGVDFGALEGDRRQMPACWGRWAADAGFGVALDGSGNIYLTGLTASTNFPVTTNAVSTRLNSAAYFGFYTNDAFVAKLKISV